MSDDNPLAQIRRMAREDGRFAFEAYIFIYDALGFTIERLGEHRHVSGQELLEGIRVMASMAFGPLAKMVFEEWGLRRTEDFGEIVFALAECDLLGKTDDDSREDFSGGYSFSEAFSYDTLIAKMDLEVPRFRYRFTSPCTDCSLVDD